MEVLFVCKYNVGRSQMATALFNKLSEEHTGRGAGVYTYYYQDKHDGTMPEGDPVIEVMEEEGIDVSENVITQVDREMVENADIVVVLMSEEKAEKDLPQYIKQSDKYRLWRIEDVAGTAAADSAVDRHRANRDRIKERVEELVREIE